MKTTTIVTIALTQADLDEAIRMLLTRREVTAPPGRMRLHALTTVFEGLEQVKAVFTHEQDAEQQ